MLQITADTFSGRPNPAWVVTDETEARATLREVLKDRQLLSSAAATDAGLGFRGLILEAMSDELAQDFSLTEPAYLAVGPDAAGRSRELAIRLIDLMGRAVPSATAAQDLLPLEAPLHEFLSGQLEYGSRSSVPDSSADAAAPKAGNASAAETAAVTCTIELGAFNPNFWNSNASIRSHNNCYNYASNKRTDTFAQPGRGCGNMYKAITCAEMTRASLCDGLHRRYVCFPDSEKPRYLVALVVAPGPGFIDFHWYRKQKEGFWGHKPGSTNARNVDNSGHVITDPQTCDRGPYTQFCGYFYTCRTQKIR
jgi:hypothetical protein